MKRKFAAVLLMTALLTGMTACGAEDPNATRYAFITNTKGTDTAGSAEADIWSGISESAQTSGYKAAVYTASSDTAENYLKQFEKASQDKAKLIIACGEEMQKPVYSAQGAYRTEKFILINGKPTSENGKKTEIRENTCCVSILWEQEGFLSGYAAVMEGFRNLAFMAGPKTDENVRSCSGFIQGAEQAASELALAPGSVTINGEYAKSDELTPLRMSDALNWYNNKGTEIIFAVGENMTVACAKAAQIVDRRVISGGVDLTGSYEKVLFGMVPDYKAVTLLALKSFETKDGFQGGKAISYGAGDGCIRISVDYSRFASFTSDMFNSIVGKISDGSVTVSDKEILSGNTEVTLSVSDLSVSSQDSSSGT